MTEVTIELDDVQEYIIEMIADDDVTKDEFVQAVFDDGLVTVYQQWKILEDNDD